MKRLLALLFILMSVFVSALILDVYFLYLGIKLWQSQDHLSARKLYLYSLLYLMLLLIAVMISSGFGIWYIYKKYTNLFPTALLY